MEQSNSVNLKWKKSLTNFVSAFGAVFDNEKLTDCTISAEGRHLRAHKIILSACSPYFEELFTDSYEKHPIIILHDVKYNTLKALIDFMYRGEVDVPQEELSGILKLSQSLQVRGLSGSGYVDSVSTQKGSGRIVSSAPSETLPSQPATVPCLPSAQNEPAEKGQLGRGCSPTVSSQGGSSMTTDSVSKSIQNFTKTINQSGSDQGTGQNAFEEVVTLDSDSLHQFPSQRQVQPTTCILNGGLVYSPIQFLKTFGSDTHTSVSPPPSSSSSSLLNPIPLQSPCSELQSSRQEMAAAVTEQFLKTEALSPEKMTVHPSAHQQQKLTETESELHESHTKVVEDRTLDGDDNDDDDSDSDGGAENEQFLIPEVVVGAADERSSDLNFQQEVVKVEIKCEIDDNNMEIGDDTDNCSGADSQHDDSNSTEFDIMELKSVSEGFKCEENFHTQGTDNQTAPFGSGYLNNETLTSSQMKMHNRYSCPSCGKSYQYLRGLQRHMKYSCGKNPQFQCPLCMCRFTRGDHLKRHMVRHH